MALVPEVFSSSATMADLSAGVSVGAARMVASLASWETRLPSLFRAVAVGSSEEDLTAAVYCLFWQNDALASRLSARLPHGPCASIAIVPSPNWDPISSASGRVGAVTYQGSGIGAIEAEEGDGRLDGLVGGGGGVEAHLRGNRPRGSCSTS